jgi:hypothetical protein
MRSLRLSLLVLGTSFVVYTVASSSVEPVQAAPSWPLDWTENWRADDGQQLDAYQLQDVAGTVAVPAAVVASLCGDFDGCTVWVIYRYNSGDSACPGSARAYNAHLFTDESALSWLVRQGDSLRQGTHGNLVPQDIFYGEGGSPAPSIVWSFHDDYIPPETFDLSYGFKCHGFVSILCVYSSVCGLRIED